MRTTSTPLIASQMEQVRRRFEHWRQHHPGRRPLPQDLWSAAAKLARQYGLTRTARVLRLGYDSLKEHVQSADAAGERRPTLSAKFIELMPCSSAAMAECSLELENVRGAKMKIQLKGTATSELSTLTRLFWSEL